jgi:anaerobic magnesium-protoporphyrin IX monomethyl ester cyclase
VAELTLLRRSGLHQICQGIETASPTVMKLMNKDFQVLGDIYESTERCVKAGVIPSFNIIFGYPGEGDKERRETVNFMMDICQKFPGAEFWTNIFTPYPGSPIFRQAATLGIDVPKTLEEWVNYFPRYTVLPWLNGKDHQRVQTMRDYLRIAFDRAPIAANGPGRFAKIVQHLTAYPARMRLNHDFYSFPIELWLNRQLKNIVKLPKPSVDAKTMGPETATSYT